MSKNAGFNSSKWVNDMDAAKKAAPVRLEELNLPINILEALYFHKNMLINEMKKKVRHFILTVFRIRT